MDILEKFIEQTEAEKPAYTHGLQRRVKRLDESQYVPAVEWQSLPEFRQTVAAAMREYMQQPDPSHMLLIPAPPGSGKTWAGVDFAHWVYRQHKHRVLYAGPRRDFFGDVLMTSVRQHQDSGQWYDWLPRQENDDPHLHTCNHGDKISQWLSMGYEGMDFCSSVCGWDWINNGCRYHAQRSTPEPLIYGNHLHVTLGHPLAEEFAVVIGDELPLSAFVHEWIIPANRVQMRGVAYDTPLAALLHELGRLCEMQPKLLHGVDLLTALGGAANVIEAISDDVLALFASAEILPPTLNHTGDISHVPANFLPTFLPILRREAEAARSEQEYPHRLLVDARGLTILTRRSVNEQMPRHCIWFDATGSAPLYEALFEREVRTLNVQPKPAGRIHQVVDRGNGKGSLIDKAGEETTRALQLRTQIDHICAQYQNPGVITHLALRDSVSQESSHFYGNRGTNEFEQCDVLVVAGTPQPPLAQIEKAARCLWPLRMQPFDQTLLTVDRPYPFAGTDGEGYSYPVAQFADPALNILLEQYREFEIVQAAHRSRMLFRDTDVYLLSNIPIAQLPVHRLLTIRELLGAPSGVDTFLWQRIVAFVEKQEIVTAVDLVEQFAINRDTAKKYMTLFVERHGWQWIEGIKRPGARGPSPKTIQRTFGANGDDFLRIYL